MSLELAARTVGPHACIVLRNLRGTAEDLALVAAALSRPEYAVARRWLVDNRSSAELPDRTDVRRLVGFASRRAEETEGLAIAVVADRDAAYGMARMLEGFASGGPFVARAFRDMESALDWLARVAL